MNHDPRRELSGLKNIIFVRLFTYTVKSSGQGTLGANLVCLLFLKCPTCIDVSNIGYHEKKQDIDSAGLMVAACHEIIESRSMN